MEKSYLRFPCLSICLFFASLFFASHGEVRSRYPQEVHQLFRDRASRTKGRMEGVWSDWTPWSPCSRTCGGGVTIQTRECVNRPLDHKFSKGKRRKRFQTNEIDNHCVGVYKRYHLCNKQACPVTRDFRAEQCAMYNSSPFRGRIYFWEPYTKAGECVLNCRAVGMGFYAQLNKTVWDGTPCSMPTTQNMQTAPKGTRGVCVSGVCKSVSTEGVIGAISPPRVPELCSECSGGCKSESLFFLKPILPPGYSFVDTIPKGACRVSISQLKHTRNFIALRHPNGTYFLNGADDVARRSEIPLQGTSFHYKRQDSTTLETITSKGPLPHPVDIMLLYHQPNPGVKYEYMVPAEVLGARAVGMGLEGKEGRVGGDGRIGGEARKEVEARRLYGVNQQNDETRPGHRRRRKKFVWKIVGMTGCTKTCGGGTMHPEVACVREHSQSGVHERRCAGQERPYNHTMRCNTQPCPRSQPTSSGGTTASWGGVWSACSATCGPGEQTRVPVCIQMGPNTNAQVHPSICSGTTPVTTRRCEIASCDPRDNELEQEPTAAQWHTGGWSQCSVTCGSGQRSRSVTCSGQCRPQDRPSTTEACHGPPCPGSLIGPPAMTRYQHTPSSITASTTGVQPQPKHQPQPQPQPQLHSQLHSQPQSLPSPRSPSSWLVTEWSESCSEECGTGLQQRWVACPGGGCEPGARPEPARACSSDKHCGGRWYAGPWGPCSDSCSGTAKQRREVLCIVHIRGQIRVVSDMTCPHGQRPSSEQECLGQCRPRWHHGEWGPCEGPCREGRGAQRRDTRCLDHQGRQPQQRCEGEPPLGRRPCPCSDNRFREIAQAQDEPSIDEDECVNTIPNCTIIIQGRMCRIQTYYKQCCASCRRAQQSPWS